MHIQNLTRLSVIEMPYGDLNWGPDPKHIRAGIYSDIQLWDKYRELDDYQRRSRSLRRHTTISGDR